MAAAVVVTVANPFADALLATGTSLGIDPYFLIQSVVPVATEAPEFVVVAVLVANRRPAQGVALFLASSVSQWTLAMGALPIAYLAGGGGTSMPLGAHAQLELGFTIAQTLFAVAALALLRPERADAALIVGVLAVGCDLPDRVHARRRHVRPPHVRHRSLLRPPARRSAAVRSGVRRPQAFGGGR